VGVLGELLNKAVVVVVVVQVVVFFSSTIIFLSRIFLLLGESIGIIDNGLFLLALLVVKIMIGGTVGVLLALSNVLVLKK